jgi:hypothetical protein
MARVPSIASLPKAHLHLYFTGSMRHRPCSTFRP